MTSVGTLIRWFFTVRVSSYYQVSIYKETHSQFVSKCKMRMKYLHGQKQIHAPCVIQFSWSCLYFRLKPCIHKNFTTFWKNISFQVKCLMLIENQNSTSLCRFSLHDNNTFSLHQSKVCWLGRLAPLLNAEWVEAQSGFVHNKPNSIPHDFRGNVWSRL